MKTILFYGRLAVGVADRPVAAVYPSSMRWAETWESSFHSPPSCTRLQTIKKRGVPVLSTKEAAFELTQKRFLSHDPQDPLMFDRPPSSLQFPAAPAVAVSGELQYHPLYGASQL